MRERMVITLNEETTRKYLTIARKRTEAEVNADCEPGGIGIRIDISSLYGNPILVDANGGWQEIGEASVRFDEAK